jgi:ribosomal protein L7/L12
VIEEVRGITGLGLKEAKDGWKPVAKSKKAFRKKKLKTLRAAGSSWR